MQSSTLLVSLGELIRSSRIAAGMTQRTLGDRSGIGGRYVSEIERGTRDLPLSTLQAIVERGLQLHLEIAFQAKDHVSGVLPAHIAHLAASIAALPSDARATVLSLVRGIVDLAEGLPPSVNRDQDA